MTETSKRSFLMVTIITLVSRALQHHGPHDSLSTLKSTRGRTCCSQGGRRNVAFLYRMLRESWMPGEEEYNNTASTEEEVKARFQCAASAGVSLLEGCAIILYNTYRKVFALLGSYHVHYFIFCQSVSKRKKSHIISGYNKKHENIQGEYFSQAP